jgi:asparagine synthetase B (glutamine-hydrolysing)
MWHSLEIRPVLLDHELVEFVLRLPDAYKIRNGRLKAVFVDAVRDYIPSEVWQREKSGFEMPLAHWMNGVLNERFLEILETEKAKNLYNEKYLYQLGVSAKRKKLKRNDWISLVILNWMNKYQVEIGE